MEKKAILPLVLAMAGACNNQADVKHPEPVIVDLASPVDESNNNDNNPQAIHNPQRITPINQVTEKIRWGFATVCGSIEPQKSCISEESRLFRTMRKKLPRAVDHRCRPDGEYEPGCIEDAYRLQFGKDRMYRKLNNIKWQCSTMINKCTKKMIRQCTGPYKDCLTRAQREVYGPPTKDPHEHKHKP